MKLVYSDSLSSLFTKLSKNNRGVSWGASDAPPMLLFDNLVKTLDKLSLNQLQTLISIHIGNMY